MTRLVAGICVWLAVAPAGHARAQPSDDPLVTIVAGLERAVRTGTREALQPFVASVADPAPFDEFASRWLAPGVTRIAIKERDRLPLRAGGFRLVLEALIETGPRARLTTWQLDAAPAPAEWRVLDIRTLSTVDGLHRLSLDASRQFEATDFRLSAEDFELQLARGSVFVVQVDEGATGLVLLGQGQMTFSPAPVTERGQVRIFAGDDVLRTPFDAAFVRVGPGAVRLHEHTTLAPVAPAARALRDAQRIFRDEVGKSFSVDLADLSGELWSLVPTTGDFLAEVRTRRFGTLTYARATNEPEDVTLFNRAVRRNISLYSSRGRLATRGPFFDEDEQADYEVVDYAVEGSFTPDRLWVEGRARLRVRVRSYAIASVTLRLARTLAVRSVTSEEHGRLLYLRVRNQDSLVVNLPGTFMRDSTLTLVVAYGGRIEPQGLDREIIVLGDPAQRIEEGLRVEPEPSFVYSNRSNWYPQAPGSGYATATIRLMLPSSYAAVCSGDPAAGSPVTLSSPDGDARRLFVFSTSQPIRYLGCVVARLMAEGSRTVTLAEPPAVSRFTGPRYDSLRLALMASPRLRARGRELGDRLADAAAFYGEIMGDVPYPSFTLAVVESLVPGGHSPAYFAAYNQPLPTTPFTWRDDPASFDNYPEFFLAHELAHQWWGQAVGWQNYHEQWISEGFAQYFAALYANRRRGPQVFESIVRQMSRWAVNTSDQGPVWLGYRLGHLRNEPRVTRALVYNKGAMVLHTLRRLVGDEAFFRSVRRFYDTHRFGKAGTDGFRAAVEAETGRSFQRFFERWIYGSTLPLLRHTWRAVTVDGKPAVAVRIEQIGEVFDLAVTVTAQLADGSTKDFAVALGEPVTEHTEVVAGPVRGVELNRDKAAMIGENGGS